MSRKKIIKVEVNNRRKDITIKLNSGEEYSMPYSRLRLKPTRIDKISNIYIDSEVANEGVTYVLESGKEDTLLYEYFLDYNKDPDYMKDLLLYNLTVEAQSLTQKSKLSKNEIIRRLSTSASQLSRLLDQTNYKKSVDEMLRLISVLGYDVEVKIKKHAA